MSADDVLRGMATMEIVVAFAVLTVTLSALAPAVFGGQMRVTESQNRLRAMELARAELDRARAEARFDFSSVRSVSATRDGYAVSLEVEPVNFWTSRAVSVVTWTSDSGRTSSLRFATLITNADLTETCSPFASGDWRAPRADTFDFAELAGDAGGRYPITGVDAFDGRLYVTTNNPSVSQATLFVFDISNSEKPALLGKFDNDPLARTGLNAIVVAPTGRFTHAYLASASSFSRGQLQIVDVSAPTVAGWAPSVTTFKVPAGAVPTPGAGNSISYEDGRVYLGLTAASATGDEFNVIDVHDVAHPVWQAGYSLHGHDLNAIRVRHGIAYLAHPTGSADVPPEQLTVLRIDASGNIQRLSGFYQDGGIGGNGKSLALVGDAAYFGRTASRISGMPDFMPEFFALDASDPRSWPDQPLASLPLPTGESVNGIVVRGDLAFLMTNRQLQVWGVSDVGALEPWTPHRDVGEFLVLPGKGASMDCEGNRLFIGSNTEANVGFITVISAP